MIPIQPGTKLGPDGRPAPMSDGERALVARLSPVTSLDEAVANFPGGSDAARDILEGRREPDSYAGRYGYSPREQSAASWIARQAAANRAQASTPAELPTGPSDAEIPQPFSIATFEQLTALPVAVVTAFAEKHPQRYAGLKNDWQQRIDPRGHRFARQGQTFSNTTGTSR